MFHFNIPTMTCGGCAKSVTQALLSIDPHAGIETNPGTAEVWVDSGLAESILLTVLSGAGFPARRADTNTEKDIAS